VYPNNDKFKFVKRIDGLIELRFRNTSLDFCIASGSIRIHAKYLTARMRDEYVPETLVSVSPGSPGTNSYASPSKDLKVDICGDVVQVLASNYKTHMMNVFSVGLSRISITIGKGPWCRFINLQFNQTGNLHIRKYLYKTIRGERVQIDEKVVEPLLRSGSQVVELTSQRRKSRRT